MANDKPRNAPEMSSTDRAIGERGHQSSTAGSRFRLVPRHNIVARQHSRQAWLSISDDEIGTSVDDAKAAKARELQVNVTLQFRMDNSVWDVIHKEVMDWRDSSWTSMHLPGDMMYFSLCLPSWNAKEPTETLDDHDDGSRQIIAKMLTVQLLASCFTSLQDINTITLPSVSYHRQHQANHQCEGRRLISSLRQHTQSKYAPAHGHHARNNSGVSWGPDQDRALSREDYLAQQVSRNRLSRRKDRRAMRESDLTKFRSQLY